MLRGCDVRDEGPGVLSLVGHRQGQPALGDQVLACHRDCIDVVRARNAQRESVARDRRVVESSARGSHARIVAAHKRPACSDTGVAIANRRSCCGTLRVPTPFRWPLSVAASELLAVRMVG